MPRLETERLLLRPPEPGDAGRFAKWLSDYEVAKNTVTIPHPFTLRAAEELIASSAEKLAKGEAYAFSIVHKTTGVLIGNTSLDLSEGSYKLSYWLGRLFWNQGYGTEAAKRIVAFAFRDLKAEKVMATWFDDNPGSGHLLEKLGFRPAGDYRRKSLARREDVLCHRTVLLREEFGRKRVSLEKFELPFMAEAVGA